MCPVNDNRHRIRRSGLMVVAVVFLLQIVAWAWMPASAMAQPVGDGDGLVICTSSGLVKLSPDGSKVPLDKDGVKAPYQCSLCLLAGTLTLPPLPIIAALPVEIARHAPSALPGVQIAAGWFLATLQARAPPVV